MREITISVFTSRKRSTVERVTLPWKGFADELREPLEGSQTLDEYLKLEKEAQIDAKDAGGYVGGTFTGNRRKRSDLKGRDILTFDLDNLTMGGLVTVRDRIQSMGVAAVIHSTRKHTKEAPRIRLIMLLDRTVTGEEYEFLARTVAHKIGMEAFDPTTFQPARLMFMPSVCKNAEYLFEQYEGKPLDTTKTLLSVPNWKDISKWHYHPSEGKTSAFRAKKQQNPLEKEGVVGAFCKTYSIYDVLDEIIPGKYISTNDPDRYTYIGATTTGGAVVYDDGLFIYSNHATDPAGGMLLNAFDLVRIHRFGELDKKAKADAAVSKLPSYAKMCEFAATDENVKKELLKERFRGESEPAEGLKALALKKNGTPKATINNVVLILQYDSRLRNTIKYNEFSYSLEVAAPLPWEPPGIIGEGSREWSESDDANLYNYVETKYGISNKRCVDEALTIVAHKNTINPVRNYLMSLSWDRQTRVATMFTDYLGAEDSSYTQTVAVKCMVGAVARALKGGVKYDYMPILTGKQGIGKSTFLTNLGRDWFTDSLTTFDSKTGAELIQGKWIAEVGELAALKKHEIEVVKQFITRTSDRYRAAYGRRAEDRKRRCVFFGTSNEDEFLNDITGNRRFLPITCGVVEPRYSVWEDMPKLVDQLWAEAAVLHTLKQVPLHLSKEEEKLAEEVRERHTVTSPLEGVIRDFVELEVPTGWEYMDIKTRKLYLASSDKVSVLGGETRYIKREYISAAEVWVECLDGDLKKYTNKDARLINSILKGMSKTKERKHLKNYGRQRVWVLN